MAAAIASLISRPRVFRMSSEPSSMLDRQHEIARVASPLELQWIHAGKHDIAARRDPDLGDWGGLDVGELVARRQQVNALVRRPAQAGGEPLAGDVAAIDQHVEA